MRVSVCASSQELRVSNPIHSEEDAAKLLAECIALEEKLKHRHITAFGLVSSEV